MRNAEPVAVGRAAPASQSSPAEPTHVVLFGLFGVGNLGNDATLLAELGQLQRLLPDARLSCVCAQLPEFARAAGVEMLPLDPLPPRGRWRIPGALLREAYVGTATLLTEPWRRRRVDAALRGVSRFIVVGTGVLDDYGEFPWTTPAWLSRWSGRAVRAGARVDMVAVGAGPIDGIANRMLMLRAVRTASSRSYRDQASRAFLSDCGVGTSDDLVVPDLAFCLPRNMLGGAVPPQSPLRSVGVGVMGYYGWRNDHARGRRLYEAYIEKMARFTAWLLDQGLAVRLLTGEVRTDDKAVADVQAALRGLGIPAQHPRLTAAPIRDVGDLLAELRQTDAVVASRFHNLVLAMVLGRPVIAVGYSPKFDSLMQEAQLGDYCHRIETLQPDRLQSDFLRLQSAHAALAQHVASVSLRYRQVLESLHARLLGGLPERA